MLFSYSVLWPTQDVQQGEECTRDFFFGISEDKQRSARLTAWFHTPENYFIQVMLGVLFHFQISVLTYNAYIVVIAGDHKKFKFQLPV